MKPQFILPNGHYFLSHSVGCQSLGTQAKVEQYLRQWAELGGDAWPLWLQNIEEFKQALANLIGGNRKDYCPQVNLSSALTKIIGALPDAKERNVILATEQDFPSMGFVLATAKAKGYEVKFLGADEKGRVELSQWQDALSSNGDRVKLAFITHVFSETCQLQDVEAICQLAKQQGVMSLVDIAQSMGIVPLSVSDWQADIVIGSCVKWCCGGPGAGFIYLSETMQSQLEPMDLGWFSHQNPFEFDIHHFEYASDASRFMGGTPSVLPFVMATFGIQTIIDIGVENIRRHNQALNSEIMFSALEQGITVSSPTLDSERGGTLVLDFSDRESAQRAFTQANIKTDLRPRFGFRFSPHIYNDMQDVEALLRVLKEM